MITEKVFIGQLIYKNDTVFYADNPNENTNCPPEYITTTNRYNHETVWVIYSEWLTKNPYITVEPQRSQMPRCLSGLINSLPADYF